MKVIKTIKLHKNEAKNKGYQLNVAMAEEFGYDETINGKTIEITERLENNNFKITIYQL